jgi:hypothetical protein
MIYGPLAQLVEQLTLNQLVVGSIPTRPTIYASAVKNLHGTFVSVYRDVVPLSAIICAIGESISACRSDLPLPGALKNDS